MNHHLRFFSQSACLAAGAFLFASCSNSKTEPPLTTTGKEVVYEIRIFEVSPDENADQERRQTLTPEQGASLLRVSGSCCFE